MAPATSPSTDARRLRDAENLIINLRVNIARFRDLLDEERARGDVLAAAVMELLPLEANVESDGHRHLLGDANVCCLMVASKIDAGTRRRALSALADWQASRTGDDRPVTPTAATEDAEAKFAGRTRVRNVG